MAFETFGAFENLEFGSDSTEVHDALSRRNFSEQVRSASLTFGPYLASAEDATDLSDRVELVATELRQAGVRDPYAVLERLAAESEDDDSDDDSDSSEDDSDVPDFVDTDDDDSKDRDDSDSDDDSEDDKKKESSVKSRTAGPFPAAPRHLDPANPGGPQWQQSPTVPGQSIVNTPQGQGRAYTPNTPAEVAALPGSVPGVSEGYTTSPGGDPSYGNPVNFTKSLDGTQAEVEKTLADPNAPGGRHRAARVLPVVPRRK